MADPVQFYSTKKNRSCLHGWQTFQMRKKAKVLRLIRQRERALVKTGDIIMEINSLFGVADSTSYRWLKEYRNTYQKENE